MKSPNGLYLIADFSFSAALMADTLASIIQPRLALVQYRDKQTNSAQRQQRASVLKSLCDMRGIPLIVNDDVGLASDIDAAGVHLGADDAPIEQARQLLGPNKIIGASCYQSLERAVSQQSHSADYVTFGTVFHSQTKPQSDIFDLDQLPDFRAAIRVPICLIGGITVKNIKPLIGAGADLIAIAGDILNNADPAARMKHCLDEISALE